MLRHVFLALTLSLVVGPSSYAGSLTLGAENPYGPMYSPSSSPFEAFQWTPLDFAAFSAYGGDFVNVRRPVTPISFYEGPIAPPGQQGPDDEQALVSVLAVPHFEQQRLAMASISFEDSPPESDSIPEPGALLLVGLGLLGASSRLRRAYRNR